jgi:uncharacterized protein
MNKKVSVLLNPQLGIREFEIKRFENLFQIRYLPQLEFIDWRCERWIRRACQKANKKGKIGELALWLGKLHGKEIESGEMSGLTIRWIHDSIGYGIFTSRPFKKWEFVGEYTGIVRPRRRIFPDVNDYCFVYPTEWLAWKAFTIDSQEQGNFTRFINHKDEPNCESIAVYHEETFHIIFRTTCDVPAGEELTYDYGSIYWLRRNKRSYDLEDFS